MASDNEIQDLLFELDSIERELEVGIVAPPARRLRHIVDYFMQQIYDKDSELEATRNELASKRYKRDTRHNQVITRDWQESKKPPKGP